MPELPEVELARSTIAEAALDRVVADVDDADDWVCRPHVPGEVRDALVGRRLTAAHRRGKTMWCDTSGDDGRGEDGPRLGLHLGMSGRIIVRTGDGGTVHGGDPVRGVDGTDEAVAKPEWYRFTLVFEDGGSMRLFDKRRLGRVRLDPSLDDLGPDAGEIGVGEFRERVGRGTAPLKARLLDQSALAGVGNLLADETLWQARQDPHRPAGDLSDDEFTALHRALRAATRAAIRHGGVHTGEVIGARKKGQHCPRCGADMATGQVGGRTTWWCTAEQQG
ncbi:DNA-formamidopyrimidine glycosylase family protein [uncultured Pseudokineococcus sp.]|uniref:DNA-formamidopyrimidine glycosylase family protein n=1 Tax=uncultured Pseudokineococcus sp. TaxID=1642928 RepID=UPI002634EB66|nr:DNA-formamidopyrimidine glycosylase family protein [uncultured Pseudokineococcus sp.]